MFSIEYKAGIEKHIYTYILEFGETIQEISTNEVQYNA